MMNWSFRIWNWSSGSIICTVCQLYVNCDEGTGWVTRTHTSLLWLAVFLASTSGACHFLKPESSLWVAAWFFLVKTPCRPQSLAVSSLLTRTLWARMFPWIRSLLWRNSWIGKNMGKYVTNLGICVVNADFHHIMAYWPVLTPPVWPW